MKKILLLSIIITGILYGKNISLDNMLDKLSSTSYQNELYNKKQEENKSKEKNYKLDTYNGVQTSVKSSYNDRYEAWETTGKASFGDFYIEGTKTYDDEDYATFGVEKNIKTLIYSKNKNELKKLDMNKEIDRIDYLSNLENHKIELILLYKEYKNSELELKIKQNGINTLQVEKNKLQTSYDMGATSKIELDSLKMNLNNLALENKVLKDNLSKIKERFYYNFNIDITNSILLDISFKKVNYDEIIKKYGLKELEKKKIQTNITTENIKYLKYDDKMPDITVGLERSTRYDENRVVLSFSKKFFGYNAELEEEKISLDQQKISLKQSINENESEKIKIYNNLYSYETEYQVNKNKANLESQKYEIKKLEYTNGKVTYLDVMESFNDYLEYQIAAEKAKNNFYGYIYELLIRSEL
ncbi:MAG: TolC family protein [Fusobacteriaceae bacterium]|nr:TolC family protein [Fusobacteriaceae bacterium]